MLPLESAVSPKLKALGFRKKGRTWWLTTASSVQVVNIQKSSFGEQLYINLGLYLKSLGTEELPPANRCHINARLERVVGPEVFEIVRSAEAHSEPSTELVEAIVSGGAGWLSHIATEHGLHEFLASELSNRCFVHRLVRGI